MSAERDDSLEETRERIESILRTFEDSIKRHKPIVFCAKCGSTGLDQNFINELRCYDCGNTIAWNGYRFSITREEDFSDISETIKAVLRSGYDEWHIGMEESLKSFMQTLIGDCTHPEHPESERLLELDNAWKECKSKVEQLLEQRRAAI